MSEVASIVDRTEPATRQIARRARERIRAEQPRFYPTPENVGQLADAFLETLFSGDIESFGSLLSEDVVVVSDGGANFHAARIPVVGRSRVARFLVNLAKRNVDGFELHPMEANGQPCFYITQNSPKTSGTHEPVTLLVISWDEQEARSLMIVRNVDKLRAFHRYWELGEY